MREKGYLHQMVLGYIHAALWSSTDDTNEEENDDTSFDSNGKSVEDLSPHSALLAAVSCGEFLNATHNILKLKDGSYAPADKVGHDLWLTRNRHGAGFWDGDYEKQCGEVLTKMAQYMGEVDVYTGDDGKIYIS